MRSLSDPEDEEGSSASEDDGKDKFVGEITPAVRSAVRRVHDEATGHRPPRRLARALLLSGAPPEAVQAARELKCAVCSERRGPKSRGWLHSLLPELLESKFISTSSSPRMR